MRHLLLSYTDGYAIQYLERNLRPYWQRNNMPVEEMLNTAEAQYASLEQRGRQFDEELTADLRKAGGAQYAAIAVLSYRQAIAAHKLVADANGDPMLFAKENFSNGQRKVVAEHKPGRIRKIGSGMTGLRLNNDCIRRHTKIVDEGAPHLDRLAIRRLSGMDIAAAHHDEWRQVPSVVLRSERDSPQAARSERDSGLLRTQARNDDGTVFIAIPRDSRHTTKRRYIFTLVQRFKSTGFVSSVKLQQSQCKPE